MDFTQFLQKWHVDTFNEEATAEHYYNWLAELNPDEWIELVSVWREQEMDRVKGIVM